MARTLNWHGHAHCHNCEWVWDMKDDMRAIDQEREATRHERQTGHATVTRLHRIDYCTEECADVGRLAVAPNSA